MGNSLNFYCPICKSEMFYKREFWECVGPTPHGWKGGYDTPLWNQKMGGHERAKSPIIETLTVSADIRGRIFAQIEVPDYEPFAAVAERVERALMDELVKGGGECMTNIVITAQEFIVTSRRGNETPNISEVVNNLQDPPTKRYQQSPTIEG